MRNESINTGDWSRIEILKVRTCKKTNMGSILSRRYTRLEVFALFVFAHWSLRHGRALFRRINDTGGIKKFVLLLLFKLGRRFIPAVEQELAKETDTARAGFRESLLKDTRHELVCSSIPAAGMDSTKLLGMLGEWHKAELANYGGGKYSGAIYHGGDDLTSLMARVFELFSFTNPLHPDMFPYIRKMEAEVVRMCCSLMDGDENSCGVMTSGGTESILLAVKTYRDWAAAEKGITEPEIVVPITIHAAFEKACHYFNIRLVHVDVCQDSYTMTLESLKKAVSRNTIMIAASAPCFPQGTIDPIRELSDFAADRGIPFHSDCCLGGLLLPFFRKLGVDVPAFGFDCKGVTSISADTHKYGYAPKGSSVILYSNSEFRRYQYFVTPQWSGGIYATPGFAGSRPGAVVACTWATLVHFGEDGYMKCAQSILSTLSIIKTGFSSIPELKILGTPISSVIAFASQDKRLNVYKVAEAMSLRGWTLNSLQNPPSVHLCVTQAHNELGNVFIQDLKSAIAEILEFPDRFKSGSVQIYGTLESIPDASIIGDIGKLYIDTLYELPEPELL